MAEKLAVEERFDKILPLPSEMLNRAEQYGYYRIADSGSGNYKIVHIYDLKKQLMITFSFDFEDGKYKLFHKEIAK
jgi:hypothetical protein